MTEGLLAGVLGEEEEKPEVEGPPVLTSAEAFAAAVAAIASRQDPQVARDTAAFLRDQSALLKVQTRHLEDEHALRLANLEAQKREATLRRTGIRIRIAFQLLIAVVAGLAGVAFLVMVRDAVVSRSVVIDSFDIAPNLGAEVPSGKIVAAGLLDVLSRIQADTRSSAEHRNLSNAWTSDIAIEMPETGISIGEIQRVLTARLGHDQHIDGDLVQTVTGALALTVRGTGILPKTFIDEARRLDTLLLQAGEYVYGRSQPGLWAAYLNDHDRRDEVIRFSQANYPTVGPGERPYLLNSWASAVSGKGGDGAMREALMLYREALRQKPDFWIGYGNIMFALAGLGDEEGLVRVGEQMIKAAGGRPGRASDFSYQNYDQTVWDLRAARASSIADMASHDGLGTATSIAGGANLGVAQLDTLLHDVEAAALRLKTTPVDERDMPAVASAATIRALLAEEIGDLTTAAREWDVFATAYANPTVSTTNPQIMCFAALTYEKTAQPAKALAALDAVGALTFVDCYRFRADLLDQRGDWPGAQVWYAKAVKLGPSIPSGYYSWGMALVRHGDLDGSIAKFKDAHLKGPHWADPLKAWGDVLVKQRHPEDAVVKYDEALRYAPNWAALRSAREMAAQPRT